jgi:hypothetical protein
MNWYKMASAEFIVATAIRQGDQLYTLPKPARHDDVRMFMKSKGISPKVGEQGFITNTGRFVDRREGAQIALSSGQIKALKFQKHELFSEDLW